MPPILPALAHTFGNDRPQNNNQNPELRNDGFGLKHVHTFSGIVGGASKTYRRAFDEALKHSEADARAMRRDGWLIALLRERQMPSARAKWHLEPEDDSDPRQVQAAKLLTDVIGRTPRFTGLRLKLLEALWYGRYGVQLVTGRDRVKRQPCWRVRKWLPVHGDKWVFRHDGTPGVLIHGGHSREYKDQGATVLPTDRGLALFLDNPAWRRRFVVHAHEVDDADWSEPEMAGGVAGVGLRHHVQWLWWLLAEVKSQLLDYLARVGAGGLTIVWYDDGNAASEAKARQVAEDLQSGNVIIAPRSRGTDKTTAGVERIEPSQVGSQVLIELAERMFEQKIERLFVGQTLSSGTEGSGLGGSGVAEMHADTKYQLISLDAENLDETITDDLVTPLLAWNVPGADFRLRFVSDLSKPDPSKVLEAVNKAWTMGAEFVEDEVRALTGLSTPKPGDKVLSKAQQEQASAMLGGGLGGPGGPPGAGPDGSAPPPGGPGGEGPGPGQQPQPGTSQGQPMPNDGNGDENAADDGANGTDDEQGVHAADSTTSPDIQAYFQAAVDSGDLFTPDGLQRLAGELASGAWRGGGSDEHPVRYARAEAKPHKFSSTQFDLPPDLADAVWLLGRRIPDDELAADGREHDPHVTVKYGLETDDTRAVWRAVRDAGPVAMRLGKVSVFTCDEHDVVKVEVHSPALHDLNRRIADSVACTDTHPTYQPHVTVAYVKPGKGAKYAGDGTLDGRTFTADSLVFSDRSRTRFLVPLADDGDDYKIRYARDRAQWSAYTGPDGRTGWRSAGGRVVYEDPTAGPDEHPHGRKRAEGSEAEGKPEGNFTDTTGRDSKLRRHVGVERGKAGDVGRVQQQLAGMLDNPQAVTPASMANIVSALQGLTVQDLNQLRQQYGGKRGRKGEMVTGLTKRLQDEGLPAPGERKRIDIDATAEVAKATGGGSVPNRAANPNDPGDKQPGANGRGSPGDRISGPAGGLNGGSGGNSFGSGVHAPDSTKQPAHDPADPFTWPADHPAAKPAAKAGPRSDETLWVRGETFQHRDAIKQLGGHWDAANAAWIIPAGAAEQAKKLAGVRVAPAAYPKKPAAPAVAAAGGVRTPAQQPGQGQNPPAAPAPAAAKPADPATTLARVNDLYASATTHPDIRTAVAGLQADLAGLPGTAVLDVARRFGLAAPRTKVDAIKAIAARIVDRHGAYVRARDSEPGGGKPPLAPVGSADDEATRKARAVKAPPIPPAVSGSPQDPYGPKINPYAVKPRVPPRRPA